MLERRQQASVAVVVVIVPSTQAPASSISNTTTSSDDLTAAMADISCRDQAGPILWKAVSLTHVEYPTGNYQHDKLDCSFVLHIDHFVGAMLIRRGQVIQTVIKLIGHSFPTTSTSYRC